MHYQEKIKLLVDLVRKSGKTVVLTGAGVSTESGIPDFRSKDEGLWNKYKPEEVASIEALKRDPETFYKLNNKWWRNCLQAKPNQTHYALAQLEKMGWILGVITQNIDGLHQQAGSERVWEVHGHLRNCRCIKCQEKYEIDRLQGHYRCDTCDGLLRPNVVLFGDAMSEDYFTAEKVMAGCQLLLVVGSSLQVYPVAGLPFMARQVAVINRDPTPWDGEAVVAINKVSGKVLADILELLGQEKGPYYLG
ncbi:MAG: NAD-dependent deacylase [Firmicutes bacterium]|nr:NAD-dependent deacylase [Bacillota bacterium]